MRSTILYTTPRNTRRLLRHQAWPSILSEKFRLQLVHKSSAADDRGTPEGARVHGGPQPPFTVVAAKTEGVTPGFRIKDVVVSHIL